ncbi:MAG: hypothetical protein ACK55N_14365 [Planctomycetota bacterium]
MNVRGCRDIQTEFIVVETIPESGSNCPCRVASTRLLTVKPGYPKPTVRPVLWSFSGPRLRVTRNSSVNVPRNCCGYRDEPREIGPDPVLVDWGAAC